MASPSARQGTGWFSLPGHVVTVYNTRGAGNGPALLDWLRVLNYVRNVCAHHSRLWNRNLVNQIESRWAVTVRDLLTAEIPRCGRKLQELGIPTEWNDSPLWGD